MIGPLLKTLMGVAGRGLSFGRAARGAKLSASQKPEPPMLGQLMSSLLRKQETKSGNSPRRKSRRHKARKPLSQRLLSMIPKSPGRKRRVGWMDKAQAAADVAGIADQSGFTDLVNAGVSLGRGAASKNKEERKAHFKDAAIRAVSAVPLVGDFAKVARARRYGDIAHSIGSGRKASKAASNTSTGSGIFRKAMNAIAPRTSRQSAVTPTKKPGDTPDGMPKPTGLTASQKIGMMGAGRQAIDTADQEARREQERREKEEELIDRQEEMANTLGKFKKGILAAIAALAALPKVTERWAGTMVESRIHLAAYNGTLAAAYAQLEVSRIMMDMRTANASAGSSANVAEELRRLRENMQDLREMKETLNNLVASGALWIANGLTEAATNVSDRLGLTDLVRQIERWLGNGQNQQTMPLHQAFDDMLQNFGQNMDGRRNNLPPL